MTDDSGCVHELLGAPSLLYRHVESMDNVGEASPWGMEAHEVRYLHRTQQEVSRVRARWYQAPDHPFRRNLEQKHKKRKRKKDSKNNEGEKKINGQEISQEEKNAEQQTGRERENGAESKEDSDEAGSTEGQSDHRHGSEQNRNVVEKRSRNQDASEDVEGDEKASLEDTDVSDDEERAPTHSSKAKSDDVRVYQAGSKKSTGVQHKGPWSSAMDDSDEDDEEWSPMASEDDDDESLSLSDQDVDPSELSESHPKHPKVARLVNPEFLKTRTDPTVQAAREHLLGEEEAKLVCPPYQQYDHPYIPGRSGRKRELGLSKDKRRASRFMQVERMNADTAYLAPFGYPSLHYCVDEDKAASPEEQKLKKSKRRQKTYPNIVITSELPIVYGNCLHVQACTCDACRSSNEEGSNEVSHGTDETSRQSWCLLHPTGEMLSSVCVSNVILPRGTTNSSTPFKRDRRHRHKRRPGLDVGETILQITACGNGRISNSKKIQSQGVFVVRTANYCTVIRVRTARGHRNDAPVRATSCSGLYHVEEVTRIDLRSLSHSYPLYKPVDVATHPHYGDMYSKPKFAILSRSRSLQCNSIHHVSLLDTPLIEEHNIPSLKSISLIDFTSSHPMTLWAAGESYVRPKLVTDIYSKRPMLGHGHSLYSVDLRSNEATFQWSPSMEEMVVEGVHSISGIMTDWKRDHSVWVNSMSAGKTYEIDDRMPCRVINTFSLPSISDEGRTLLPATGLYGGGSILTQPVVSTYRQQKWLSSPILCVDKTPGAFGIHVYQRPEFRPRFQTNGLECISCPGLSSRAGVSESSMARSSCFPLPDVSESVFTCGLASFQTSASDFLSPDATSSLGYNNSPQDILCVLTITNKGDLYSHALLECPNEEESRSEGFPGLPLGCTALAIPPANNPPGAIQSEQSRSTKAEFKAHGGLNLPLTLTNEFPLARSELAYMHVKAKKECMPFTTVRLEHLPVYSMANCTPRQGTQETSKASTQPSVELPSEYTTAAHEEAGRLQQSFSLDRTSVVEGRAAPRNEDLRSDMNAEVFETASGLWAGDENIVDHAFPIPDEKEDHTKTNERAYVSV